MTEEVTLKGLGGTVKELGGTVKELGGTVKGLNDTITILSQKFDLMLSGFAEVRQDIVGLKNDVSGLKNDVSGLKREVTTLQDDMRGVKKYIKLESIFQERQNKEFISKMYIYNHPSNIVVTLHIQQLYTCINREITDADGFLLISSVPIQTIEPSKDVVERIQNKNAAAAFVESLKRNNTYNMKQSVMEYIIIESKHSLSKGKVDKKIRQMKEIHDMLSNAPTMDPKKCFPLYKKMIQDMMQSTRLSLDKLNLPINLIFSSDDISHELCNYVCAIHDGISEEVYNELSLKLLYLDEYAHEIIKEIYKDNTIPKQIKSLLSKKEIHSTRQALDIIVEHDKELEPKITYLQDYVTPFSELEPFFAEMKNKIGVSQFNTITFPSIFTKQTLNQ